MKQNTQKTLEEGEAFIFVKKGEIKEDKLNIGGYEVNIKERLDSFPTSGYYSAIMTNSFYLIV